MDPYDWFIDACREYQPNKHKVALYKPSIYLKSGLKQLYISSKTECFSYKGGCGMMHIKAFKRTAIFGYI